MVTIFLDAERFLDEAVQSVFAQTYPRWELLLVDDGSKDSSPGMARRYAEQYPGSVRYLQHPGHDNRGTGASRQLGIDQAAGEYIAFLDADDLYLPEKLECQVAVLEEHRTAGMVFGPTPHWHGWTGLPEDIALDSVRRLGVPAEMLIQPPRLVEEFLARRADTPATCGVLVRRSAIDAVGGFDTRFVDLFEDQAFFYQVCLAVPVYVQGRAHDRYRRHARSMTTVRAARGDYADDYRPNRARGAFLIWLDGYFREQGITDRRLRALLRRELWPYRHPRLYRAARMGRAALRRVLPVGWRRALQGFAERLIRR